MFAIQFYRKWQDWKMNAESCLTESTPYGVWSVWSDEGRKGLGALDSFQDWRKYKLVSGPWGVSKEQSLCCSYSLKLKKRNCTEYV